MTLAVRAVAAAETHDLRRRILRNGDPLAAVVWPGDDDATTVHLAAVAADGRIVGVSTWLVAPDPLHPDVPAIQLRGMATDADVTGRGIGSMLLEAGTTHARTTGAERLWANARVTAVGFYERAGFVAQGPVFVTPTTGLPHRHVHIAVA